MPNPKVIYPDGTPVPPDPIYKLTDDLNAAFTAYIDGVKAANGWTPDNGARSAMYHAGWIDGLNHAADRAASVPKSKHWSSPAYVARWLRTLARRADHD